MSVIYLVGGAAATGKSSLVKALAESTGAGTVRPSDCFLYLAAVRGVPASQAFSDIPAEDAEDRFLALCVAHERVVSDIHYAIQPARDSALAAGVPAISTSNAAYYPSLSNRMLRGLDAHHVVLVLLVAPAALLLSRAGARDGEVRRANSLADVHRELAAERREFESACARSQRSGVILDTSQMSTTAGVRRLIETR